MKTKNKKAVTSEIGKFDLHETIKFCDVCGKKFYSDESRKVIPYFCRYSFSLIVEIGIAIFIEARTERQICSELKKRRVPISIRQVGYLGKKFIIYLALLHKDIQSNIKKLLSSKGGYIFHLDGTCEGNSPHLMTGLDELSNIVLGNIKIPSEKSDDIIPFLEKIKNAYGAPIALVHDMGSGILLAVKKVFPGVADFICHYHFLRDIGKDLFGNEYSIIMNALREYRIRPSLRKISKALLNKIETDSELTKCLDSYLEFQDNEIQKLLPTVSVYLLVEWILDADSDSNGYGFPFDQPHLNFYQRLLTVKDAIMFLPTIMKKDKCIIKLSDTLGGILKCNKIEKAVIKLEEKLKTFCLLREALRIASPDGKKGLNDDGDEVDMKAIEKAVKVFRNSEEIEAAALEDNCYRKLLKQLDKYWEKLFADPITVTTSSGERVAIYPQRTNNILERFFRDMKRMFRKKSGNKSLNRILKSMLADTPLIKNLSNPEYMKILLNGKDTLEERFAEIDDKLVRKELKRSEGEQNKTSKKMKKAIRNPNFPATITRISKEAA